MKKRPDYDITSYQAYLDWHDWCLCASLAELRDALRGCASWNTLPAMVLLQHLFKRGYTTYSPDIQSAEVEEIV